MKFRTLYSLAIQIGILQTLISAEAPAPSSTPLDNAGCHDFQSGTSVKCYSWIPDPNTGLCFEQANFVNNNDYVTYVSHTLYGGNGPFVTVRACCTTTGYWPWNSPPACLTDRNAPIPAYS